MDRCNMQDIFFSAVERYNKYVFGKNTGDLSYETKRGLFYNFLRNGVGSFGTSSRAHSSLNVKDLNCSFDDTGKLVGLSINKKFYWNWGDEELESKVNSLKSLADNSPVLYSTKLLNEMASIVKSIK